MAGRVKAAPAAAPFAAAAVSVVDSCGAPCHWWHHRVGTGFGVCKRFPPVPLAGAGNLQPITGAEDWCGEFAPTKAKPS